MKVLIHYSLKNLNNSARSSFNRELYGYLDKSNRGKYLYKRKGILSYIPYTKLTKSVLIINKKYLNRIKTIFKKYRINYKLFQLKK